MSALAFPSASPRRLTILASSCAAALLAACSSTGTGVQAGSIGASDAVGGGGGNASSTSGQVSTTSSTPITAWPLTGVSLSDGDAARRVVVVAKIDNAPAARPQSGINQADSCIEEKVEGITRLMCLFHSGDADPVGPIRSARSSDVDLMGPLNRPLLLWSGGNPGVTSEVQGSASLGFLIEAGEPTNKDRYYRDNRRQMPHNLYTSTAMMRDAFSPVPVVPPHPVFAFRAPDAPLPIAAEDAPGVTVDFGRGVKVDYVWDQERLGWNRFQVDESHPRGRSAVVDVDGVQVAPANVVILLVPYGESDADSRSPKAITQGEGDAIVLTAGKLVYGHWKRPVSFSPWELTDKAGNVIELTRGRTWIALPEAGGLSPVVLDAEAAGQLQSERK